MLLTVLFFILPLLTQVAFCGVEKVIELNPQSLSKLEDLSKTTNVTLLVLFYAPWCYYSKKVLPVYDQAAALLPARNPQLYLVKIDASKYKADLKSYKIGGYPTIVYLINGTRHKYTGDRSVEDLSDFVEKVRRK
ncbi:unnamed protein product [Mesocestoides corti]|uniref:Thioredoxin domain-containing protein n=1 Tax=Mesocestoides corti TaxID=53468 RepID=A0A0R3U563_MESCO|nr:unnamed protein product [Mesocestoides corti]